MVVNSPGGSVEGVVHDGHAPAEDGGQQVLLGVEVVVDRRGLDADIFGDAAQRGGFVVVVQEPAGRHLEDAGSAGGVRPGIGRGAYGGAGGRRGHESTMVNER